MIGSLIGSAVGGTFSLIGGIGSSIIANKGWNAATDIANKRINNAEQRMKDNQAHRDRLYYQDPTQTAENQASQTQAQEVFKEAGDQAEGRKIVSGGTDESVALQKQAASAAVSNMIQQQAVAGAEKKEDIWDKAQAQDNALNSEDDTWSKYLAEALKTPNGTVGTYETFEVHGQTSGETELLLANGQNALLILLRLAAEQTLRRNADDACFDTVGSKQLCSSLEGGNL